MDWNAMVTVGRVIRPHGVRGQVIVVPETDFADARFAAGSTLHISREGFVSPLVVGVGRPHDGRWIVGFVGIETMDAADTIRGLELRIAASDVRVLGAGSYYLYDLVGCMVTTVSGHVVGPVERVDMGTGIPMLIVAGADVAGEQPAWAHEIQVPFTDAICRSIDVGARVIAIDPPEGLIELNQRTPDR